MNKKAIILLVEDDRMDIELTLDAFREARLENEIRVVQTGEEALDYLFGRGEYADRGSHPLPDLILLDLNLPGISGLEVLKILKQTPLLKRLAITILTSSKEESDRASARLREVGGDGISLRRLPALQTTDPRAILTGLADALGSSPAP